MSRSVSPEKMNNTYFPFQIQIYFIMNYLILSMHKICVLLMFQGYQMHVCVRVCVCVCDLVPGSRVLATGGASSNKDILQVCVCVCVCM